jgi:hypothetical protein
MATPTDFNPFSLRFPIEEYLPAGAPRPPISTQERSYKNERREMCNNMVELGGCPYGDKCGFAHCIEEIKALSLTPPPNYRRDLCRNFFGEGICYYGTRCRFSHSLSYAHALGYVYYPSISAYVKRRDILHVDPKSKENLKVVGCWSTRKTGLAPSSDSPAPLRDVRPVT